MSWHRSHTFAYIQQGFLVSLWTILLLLLVLVKTIVTGVIVDALRGLRSQLAEDGCPDSQVVLAKQLLEEPCDLDVDKEENARLGVYWLIKASEQGNEEATKILQQCLEMGRGITELNFLDVKACLSMSQEEKLARKAARKMFSRLSAGEDYITSEQLRREMIRIIQRMEGAHSSGVMGVRRWPIHLLAGDGNSLTNGNSQRQKLLKNVADSERKANGANGTVHDQLELLSEDEDQVQPSVEDWASRTDPPGEKLSEDHLVSAAVMYAQGELPLVQRMLDLQHPDSHPPILILNPFRAIVRAYTVIVEVLGRGNHPLPLPPISSAIQVLLMLVLYSLLESVDWYTVVPVAVYHASFMAMIVFTCNMLHNRHEFQHFRVWSGLFLRYSGGSLNPDEAEYQFCRNNMRPYAHFFIALILNLMMYPLLVPHWAPHSELTVISLSLTFLSLYAFLSTVPRPVGTPPSAAFQFPRKQLDMLVLFSLAVNVLAKYPYDLDTVVTQGWRYLDVRIPTFASYVVGHGVEFCLNFKAVFYLLMPAVFLKLAARDQWRGTYRILIPHCVTLAWWQIAVLTARSSTWYGLIRAALALVGLVLFLPLAGLATVLLPLAAAARYVSLGPPRETLQAVVTTALLASPLLVMLWLHGRHSPQGTRRARLAKFAAWVQVALALGAGVLLMAPYLQSFGSGNVPVHKHSVTVSEGNVVSEVAGARGTDHSFLAWEQFQNMCHQPAWEQSSMAHAQLLCSQLDGVPVKWGGYVASVRIIRIKNPWLEMVRRLPESLGSMLACAVSSHGEEKPDEDKCSPPFHTSTADQERCKMIRQLSTQSGRCLLSEWDRYDFEVNVKMKSGLWSASSVEVSLLAEDFFRNMTFALRPGDHIWFRGTLINAPSDVATHDSVLGGTRPHIRLDEAGCLECKLRPESVGRLKRDGISPATLLGYAYCGVKFVLNFLFNPIVVFK